MFISKQWHVNENFGAFTQSLYVLAGYAIFYGISAIRSPWRFAKMFFAMFFRPEHDFSRLQRALKGFLRTKKLSMSRRGTRRVSSPD